MPGIRGIQLAVNKRVSLGELVVGMGGCCILGSRKMVLLHLGCSIGVRGNRFSLRQITKLQERGKLSGRSMLERLSVFSSCVSGCNDLCRCWLSYNNAKVIISEGWKSLSAGLSCFSKALFSVADSHLCSILRLKLNSDDQFVPYVVPLGLSIENPWGGAAHPSSWVGTKCTLLVNQKMLSSPLPWPETFFSGTWHKSTQSCTFSKLVVSL